MSTRFGYNMTLSKKPMAKFLQFFLLDLVFTFDPYNGRLLFVRFSSEVELSVSFHFAVTENMLSCQNSVIFVYSVDQIHVHVILWNYIFSYVMSLGHHKIETILRCY